jgi:SpoVK/Ycf46/Vps4 family AAA+-type ATPase
MAHKFLFGFVVFVFFFWLLLWLLLLLLLLLLFFPRSMGFISVKGPELLDPYIGESERKVRAVFARARQTPGGCVVFLDEIDALAPRRGGGGGYGGRPSPSGGAQDRVVSQLMTELDRCRDAGGVFVMGATNRLGAV